MEITTNSQPMTNEKAVIHAMHKKIRPRTINGIQRLWVAWRVRFTILMIALRCYGSMRKAIKISKQLQKFKATIYGKNQIRRCIRLNDKYYFGLYIPAFPSKIFNRYIQTELNCILPHRESVNRLQCLQLAITNRCPLKCEHCFEWNNLNKPEAFTSEELVTLINKFQNAGCAQFHLTGGEPLVKMNRLKKLVSSAMTDSEFLVLTSGLNLTAGNAKELRQAGVLGVVISLDHFDPAMHNIFRGSAHAYDNAINGAHHAQQAGLLTAFSICVTRSFVSKQNLLRYAQLARDCGVAFVQLLEPKSVGHYEGKGVCLSKEQTDILEDFYLTVNFNKEFKDYPVIIYHGFHQRKIGCLSAGDRVMYIDSAGFVDACPFCQTKNYHARKIISDELSVMDLRVGGCPAYEKLTQNRSADLA